MQFNFRHKTGGFKMKKNQQLKLLYVVWGVNKLSKSQEIELRKFFKNIIRRNRKDE